MYTIVITQDAFHENALVHSLQLNRQHFHLYRTVLQSTIEY